MVVFPYTGIDDIKQKGYVVRVEKRREGRRGVAIALGAAAAAVRAELEAAEGSTQVSAPRPPESPRESRVEDAVRTADLKFQLAQARQEASFLALELADLKVMYQRTIETSQLVVRQRAVAGEFGELLAAKAAMDRVIEELKREIETMRKELSAAHVGRELKKKS